MANNKDDGTTLVFAATSAVLYSKDNMPYRIIGGQPWLKSDPLVTAHKDFFTERPLVQFLGTSVPFSSADLPAYLTK